MSCYFSDEFIFRPKGFRRVFGAISLKNTLGARIYLLIQAAQRAWTLTYTRAADIYIGDVSSQIYEFLIKPRPCIFLNSHHAAWQGNPDYAFWNFGPVIDSVAVLDTCLRNSQKDHSKYWSMQEQGFRTTFDQHSTPASARAADAG